MTLKSGDMVIVVKTPPRNNSNIGKILLITEPAPSSFPGEWMTEPKIYSKSGNLLCVVEPFVKKIENPGDDEQDETLSWLAVPTKEKEQT